MCGRCFPIISAKEVISMTSNDSQGKSVLTRLQVAVQEAEGHQQCLDCNYRMDCGRHDCIWQEVSA